MKLLYYFTGGLVPMCLHSLETCWLSFLLLSHTHTKWFSFLQLESRKLPPSKQRCHHFPKVIFYCKTDRSNEEMKMSKCVQKCPPRLLIFFPEIIAKKVKVKAIPDNLQQISWPELLVSSYRKNQWLRHTYSLSPSLHWSPEMLFSWSGDRLCPGTQICSEKPWVCTTH